MNDFRLALERADVVSFDVFDTLVHRPGLFSPKDLFYLLEDEVAKTLGREVPDFAGQRIQAEKEARVRAWGRGVQDVSLAAIYRELGRRLGVRGERLDRLMQNELDAERSVLAPCALGGRLLEVAREVGKGVVLVSDTYFGAAFVEEVLGAGGYSGGDPVYASSAYGKTKDDGSLFRVVLEDLGVAPGRLLHVGDNIHSDFNVPLGLGIRSFPVPTSKGRLRSLCSVGDVPSGHPFSAAVLSDASERYWNEEPGPKGTLGRSSVRLAVLYLAFAVWVVRRVREAGCRTVYFASRDGMIMQRFFDLVARADGVDVQSRYLYVSRMALYPTLVYSDPTVARELLAHSWDGLSIRDAVGRMSLKLGRCRSLLAKHGLSDPDCLLNAESAEQFSRFLSDAWALVRRGNEKRYRLGLSYLEQEGVFGIEPAAFVDIGWHGSLQSCLVKLLEHAGVQKRIEGYYLATFQRPPGATDDFVAEGYLLDNDEPRWLSELVRSGPSLLELFHGARHGSVLGYRKAARKVVPVLDDNPEERSQFQRVIEPIQEAAFELVSGWLDSFRGLEMLPLPRDLVARIALSMIYRPDVDEARIFGRLQHAADFGGRRKSLTGALEWDLRRIGEKGGGGNGAPPLWGPGFQLLKTLGEVNGIPARTPRTARAEA